MVMAFLWRVIKTLRNCGNGCMTVNTLNIKLHNLNRWLIWNVLYISVKLLKSKTDPSRINPAYAWLPTVVFKLSVEGSLGSLGLLGLEVEVRVEGYMSVKHTLQLCLEMSCLLSCMFSFLACPLS